MFSATLPPVDGTPIGQHPLVVQLLRGDYNRNPPRPKYRTTWDPDKVLSYISVALATNDNLSLRTLAQKTSLLLTMSCFLRTAEVASILFTSVELSSEDASFMLGDRRKAQHSGPLQTLQLRALGDNSAVCSVSSLRAYRDRTSPLRARLSHDSFFIQSIKPHDPVEPATIASWCKDLLGKAGVDTHFFFPFDPGRLRIEGISHRCPPQ